jgi:drug/metabolite transporter (DMT)-like permease
VPSGHAPRLLLVLAALLFSTGGAAIKLASLSAWQIACLRSGLAACFLLLVSREARRLSPRALLVGLAYAAVITLYVVSNRLTTNANAVFLQSTAPLYLLAIGPLLLRERLRRADLSTLLLMGLGMLAIFLGGDPVQATAPNPSLGNLVGCAQGLAWALTVAGLRWLGRAGANLSAVLAGNLIACMVALPLALAAGDAQPIDALDWVVCLWLGFFQIGLAYLWLGRGMREVPALEASLILFLEPVLSPLWTWLVHAEVPGAWSLVGGAVILLAAVLRVLRR